MAILGETEMDEENQRDDKAQKGYGARRNRLSWTAAQVKGPQTEKNSGFLEGFYAGLRVLERLRVP